MTKQISFQSVSRVLETWELARQKYGSEEELGMEILFGLFRAAPDSKAVFGFRTNQDIESNPMLRMGALVHSARMVQMLDGAFSLMGPDMEMLADVLGQLGQRHQRHGVKKEYVLILGDVLRNAISDIIGDEYKAGDDEAWKDIFDLKAGEIVKSMD